VSYTSHIVFRPSGITPEPARDARARAWAFVFDCFARKRAVELAPESNGRDVVKESNGYDATGRIPPGS
jgi:hypothetical protein